MITGTKLQHILGHLFQEDRDDFLQELELLKLEHPGGSLHYYFLEAMRAVFPVKTRARIRFGSIKELYKRELMNQDRKAEKLLRLEVRSTYRIKKMRESKHERLIPIVKLFLLDGLTQTEISKELGLDHRTIYDALQRYAHMME